MSEPICSCQRSGSIFYEPEFECEVHGDVEAKRNMMGEEHAQASAKALVDMFGGFDSEDEG